MQNKTNERQNLKQGRGLKALEAQPYQDFPWVHSPPPEHVFCSYLRLTASW